MDASEEMVEKDYLKMLEANASMDKILEKMLQQAKKNPKPQNNQSIDEIISELQNHPAFAKEIDWSKPLSPEMEGLIALKYELEDPNARAESYKEEGNYHFKKKEYRLAIDNYTEGLKSKSPSREINAVLYANRAAANFYLGNFRSSLLDCVFACKFKPNHRKAIVRAATCCYEIQKYEDCIEWCDSGLLFDPQNKQLLDLRTKAVKGKKLKDRDERKQAMKEKKDEAEDSKLLEVIKSKGIRFADANKPADAKTKLPLLSLLEAHTDSNAHVHVDSEGGLVWPVLFLYPEYSESDFIQAFPESHNLYAHISHMFGPDVEPAPWDQEMKYKPDCIKVYFEDQKAGKLIEVDVNSTLLKVLQHPSIF